MRRLKRGLIMPMRLQDWENFKENHPQLQWGCIFIPIGYQGVLPWLEESGLVPPSLISYILSAAVFLFGCALIFSDLFFTTHPIRTKKMGPLLLALICIIGLIVAAVWWRSISVEPEKLEKRDVIKIGDKEVHELKIGNLTIQTQKEKPCDEGKPLTISKLYECDFVDIGHTNVTFAYKLKDSESTIAIKAKQFTMYEQNSKFLSFYISRPTTVYEVATYIADNYEHFLNEMEKNNGIVAVITPGDSDQVKTKDLINSKRVFMYHEDNLSSEQIYILKKAYENKGLSLILRGQDYLNAKIIEDNRKKNIVTR